MGNLCSSDTDGVEPHFSSDLVPDQHHKSNKQQRTDNPLDDQQNNNDEASYLSNLVGKHRESQYTSPSVKPVEEKKLDPKDFIVSKRQQEVIVREPGQIAGQSFVIEECQNCDIYLLDYSAAVTIDVCTDCRFFIGPCESSVFIRDCSNCTLIVAAQQVRIRDCHSLSLHVYVSASQPVIEASHSLLFSCFPPYSYTHLTEQFQAAGLQVWQSEWSNIHDFHAKNEDGDEDDDDEKQTPVHWQYAAVNQTWEQLGMKDLNQLTTGRMSLLPTIVTPYTYGNRPHHYKHTVLVLLRHPHDTVGFTLLQQLSTSLHSSQLYLIRSKHRNKMKAADAVQWFGNSQSNSTVNVVGLEFHGQANARELIQTVIRKEGWTREMIVVVEETQTQKAIEHFFEAAAQV